MVSLDNNAAERALRRPVMTRKNAYGSRNDDAARLAARTWTVTATAEMAGLNVLTYLTAYLDACGRNGGKPLAGPDLERFLPGPQTPLTCAPGRSRPRQADTPAHHDSGVTTSMDRRLLPACPLTRLPSTYRGCAWVTF